MLHCHQQVASTTVFKPHHPLLALFNTAIKKYGTIQDIRRTARRVVYFNYSETPFLEPSKLSLLTEFCFKRTKHTRKMYSRDCQIIFVHSRISTLGSSFFYKGFTVLDCEWRHDSKHIKEPAQECVN